jgi:hypothetical protein
MRKMRLYKEQTASGDDPTLFRDLILNGEGQALTLKVT